MGFLDFNDVPDPSDAPRATWAQGSYSRDEVLASVLPRLESVLGYLYPQGFADPKGRVFYIGDASGSPGESLSVQLTGQRAGLWYDFATGEGGDIFDLWAAARGMASFRDVLQDLGDYAGASANTPRKAPKRKPSKGGEAWAVPTATYDYRDASGRMVAQVDRFDWHDGDRSRKTFRPWSVKDHAYKAPEARILYNLPEVATAPEIVLVEGEKCVDALRSRGIVATSAMSGSNAPISATDWTPLHGRKVIIWPDNDEPGLQYAEAAREAVMAAGALSAVILRVPSTMPVGWDAADAVESGLDPATCIRDMLALSMDAERDGIPAAPPFRSWEIIDPATVPARQFLYGHHYIRKFASLTIAPGGASKSTLVLSECIAMATGRNFLGPSLAAPLRVFYYNAEDPLDEIVRRVLAICQHHGIDQSELVGQLFVASGRDHELILSKGDAGEIVEASFDLVERFAIDNAIDVVAMDPLANLTDAPETNDAYRRLSRRISQTADRCNAAMELVHHARKLNGAEATVEDSRGGSALIGAVRSARVLNQMTPEDAERAGLETHIDHFRIEAAGKNNMSRGDAQSTWFKRVSVLLPNGDNVAAIEPWRWPDAFDGISRDDARKVQIAIMAMDEKPAKDSRNKRWVGHVIADVLGMDASDKADAARIKTMIKTWLASGVLSVETVFSARDGREIPAIVAGKNILSGE